MKRQQTEDHGDVVETEEPRRKWEIWEVITVTTYPGTILVTEENALIVPGVPVIVMALCYFLIFYQMRSSKQLLEVSNSLKPVVRLLVRLSIKITFGLKDPSAATEGCSPTEELERSPP